MNPAADRTCAACGQRIPASAKLAAVAITREQLAVLSGTPAADAPASAELCLRCRIRLAEIGKTA